MGVIFSRFRKKKTTLEVLEGIEKTIKSVEEYRLTTEQRHKTIVGHLVLYSVALYVIAAVLFYFCFFPASLYDQLLYITPLLLFPLIVVLLKRLVTWYYHRKISKNQDKLEEMFQEKKKLLEEVMDKETYKVARQILEKYAPDQLRKTTSPQAGVIAVRPGGDAMTPTGSPTMTPPRSPGALAVQNIGPGTELRRRTIANSPSGSPRGHQSYSPQAPGAVGTMMANKPPLGMPQRESCECPKPEVDSAGTGASSQEVGAIASTSPVPLPLPRPILPRERTALDRLVEYLVGDGPSARYALICINCRSHNGMALKEEFEYFAFRCCYCYHWNPARKQRPMAPRLESGLSSNHTTSASELDSNSSDDNGIPEAGESKDAKKPSPPESIESTDEEDEEEAVGKETASSLPTSEEIVLENTDKMEKLSLEAKELPAQEDTAIGQDAEPIISQ